MTNISSPHRFPSMLLSAVFIILSLNVGGIKASEDEEKACISDETAQIRVELFTDFNPGETQWVINDAFSRAVIFSGGPYTNPVDQHEYKECVARNRCYQFTISDIKGDGLGASANDRAYYQIFYDDVFIADGEGDFGFLDHSPLFGEACPTLGPSLSLNPSNSPVPSQSPSDLASEEPSLSKKPSVEPSKSFGPSVKSSQKPSFSPTDTSVPTFSPTEQPPPTEFTRDSFGRRRFPPPLTEKNDGSSFPFQPLPSCKNATTNSNNWLGCINYPKPDAIPKPDWVGKIIQKIPECTSNENGRNRNCHLNFPVANQLVPSYLKPASFGFEESNNFILRNNSSEAFNVEAVDLDNDGLLDIIVGNSGVPNQVFFNKDNGEFEDPIDLDGGSYYTAFLEVGDLDGNGFVDFICANFIRTPSSIIWNEGGRKFTASPLPGVYADLDINVAIWDFDGNGQLDIIVTMYQLPNLLLSNNGDRNFTVTHLVPGPDPSISFHAECGDLDNDGDVDILIANIQGGSNQLLWNNGNGTFEVTTLPGITGDTYEFRLADFSGNGYLDVVATSGAFLDQGQNQILWNLGNREFVPQDLPDGLRGTQNANIADIDGDGKLDIIIKNQKNPHLLLLYDGDRDFDVIELPFVEPYPMGTTLADIDRNGMIDILFTTKAGVQILMNHVRIRADSLSGEDLVPAELPGIPQGTVAIVVGPLISNDNYLNLVIGNFREPNQLVRISDEGYMSQTIILPGGELETSCIVLTYFNNDSVIDIFVGNINGPNQILLNLGSGDFELINIPNTSAVTTDAAASADMDNDGRMDLLIGNRCHLNQMLLNNGDGTFTTVDLPGNKLDETMSIAVADMNGDGNIDIIVGNGYDVDQPNYLLTNNGNNTFVSEELPGGSSRTFAIAIGNLHNDKSLDIIVGNFDDKNHILHNNTGTGFELKHLPGGSLQTTSLALGDVDDDGDLDIVISSGHVGNTKQNQIVLNLGNGAFREVIIPRSRGDTRAIAICDLDKDGRLDVLFGNYRAANTFFYQPVCESGAQLHGQSWCFNCPSFMGRNTLFFGQTSTTCLECMPDHMQSLSSEVCSEFSCPFGERKRGADKCEGCPLGTFYDSSIVRREHDPESWKASHCVDCDSGEYSDWLVPAIDKCFKCPSGSSQSNPRASSCLTCSPGTFQSLQGQAICDVCEPGGYCNEVDTCGGGFTPCNPGTYNNKTGQDNIDACISCPVGTFSTEVGATSIESCRKCLPGSFTDNEGQTECTRCKEGTYQPNEGSVECLYCENGTYTNAEGQTQCVQCPYRLSSIKNSTSCQFCDFGFYLIDSSIDPSDLLMSPKKCLECPNNALCSFNTTLQTLAIPENHWRQSPDTSKIYKCNNRACKGTSPQKNIGPSSYCITGHEGPLCQVCTNDSEYFSSSGQCTDCPPWSKIGIPAGIVMGLIGVFYVSHIAAKRFEKYDNFLTTAYKKVSVMNLQPKLKIMITFYQIIRTLNDVYGVEFDERVKSWLNFVDFFQFGLSEAVGFPDSCIGSMKVRLIIGGSWPLVALFLCFVGIACHVAITVDRRTEDVNLKSLVWMRLLYISIVVIFLTLPSIAVNIYEAKKCQPFESNDATKEMASFLISDWTIRCDQGGSVYQELQAIFWAFFAVWLVAIPLSSFGLLMRIMHSVQSQKITPLAEACSFLWRDYKKDFMYWEIVSLGHKIFLTGTIMLVDTQEGSDKALRLVMAILVSTIYFGMLLYASPFQRKEDQNLALVSNVLLISCFILGIPIQLCQDGSETCQDLFGLRLTSYRVSLLAVLLIISMLVVTLIFIVIVGLNRTLDPVIKLVHTQHEPVLDLPRDCDYHAFVSHTWSSGQDKTHAMVRKLQSKVPGLKVWLDVEDLKNLDDLELSVKDSAVFIVFYTDGYFKSKNCRREIYEAVFLKKPIIVIYEGDNSVIDTFEKRCLQYCIEREPSGDQILRYIFTERPPLLWLGASSHYFSTAAVKLFSEQILRNLPYYQEHPLDLSKGLKLRGELKDVILSKNCTLVFSSRNDGAQQVASDIQAAASKTDDVVIEDVNEYDLVYDLGNPNHFFLLYLNDKVFSDPDEKLKEKVMEAKDKGFPIILVQEKDVNKGGVEFENFFDQTPRELLVSPYKLYDDLAIPLYTIEEYREISLRLVLCKMRDATEENKKRSALLRRTFFFGRNK